MQPFASAEQAQLAFAEYAQLEPRLIRLWELCQLASPPDRDDDEDELEIDPTEGWCADLHYFPEAVKPHLTELVGLDRKQGPAELQTREAYITIYRALIHHALRRCCDCCREHGIH